MNIPIEDIRTCVAYYEGDSHANLALALRVLDWLDSLPAQWTPVEDGRIETVDGEYIVVSEDGMTIDVYGHAENAWTELSDDIRLCRKVQP